MCGILFYATKTNSVTIEPSDWFDNIAHRGPDNTTVQTYKDDNFNLFFGFHRLAINGLDSASNQPMQLNGCILICNGEIFNYRQLIESENITDYSTHSDCEIIIHLYKKYGIYQTLNMLDGEFAFVIYDIEYKVIYVARDHLGIRPLFVGCDESNEHFIFASEYKAIPREFIVKQFPPRTYATLTQGESPTNDNNYLLPNHIVYTTCPYYTIPRVENTHDITVDEMINNIRQLLTDAVDKRLMSDVPIGCLLSGGIDSTIVTGLVASRFPPNMINTYTIGMKGSVDVEFSIMAANHFKTNHHIVEYDSSEFIAAIRETIFHIESYDVTTVRASIGNYLVSKWISKNTTDKVIFCGDVADELFGSYRGFMYAENTNDFELENRRLVENIHFFDVLRSDRSISGAGLEARVPFGDKFLLNYVMGHMPTMRKMWGNSQDNNSTLFHIEKYILRKAFEDMLPVELTWRQKTAFSDGVGCQETPWYCILKDHMETIYSDEEFNAKSQLYTHNKPYDKESLYYRELFEEHFGTDRGDIIPYFWKQPFMVCSDPSAWLAEESITV